MRRLVSVVGACLLGIGCGGDEGLDSGEGLGKRGPIQQIDLFLNGFHFASGDHDLQMEANHYCHELSTDLTQCVLYDGIDEEARMIGIEYVISRQLFDTLPEEEKALWHAHNYEVTSGALIAPSMSPEDELALMEQLVTTYGKTWHVWNTEVALPVGPATPMKAFYADGQLDEDLLEDRDERFGVDSEAAREERAGIEDPGFDDSVLEEPELGVCDDPDGFPE